MSRTHKPTLQLLSLNVNGLREPAKRRQLFHQLLEGPWDIAVLQETHHSSFEEGARWASEGAGQASPWTGDTYWHHFTSASRGVAILLRPGIAITDLAYADPDMQGRLQRLDFTFEGVDCTLVNAYAPCEPGQQREFFLGSLGQLLPTGRQLIMGGDWNCIPALVDQVGADTSGRLAGYRRGLQCIEERHDLHDAWRVHHPALTDFTHTGTGGFSSARLDRWLLSADVMEWVRACEILHGLPGDHCAVSVRLQAPQGVLRGPGCWRLPLGVLDDPDFINLVRARLFEFRMQHPVHDPQTATAPASSPANTSPLPPASTSAPTSAATSIPPPALPPGITSAPTPVTDSVLSPASIAGLPLGTVSAPTCATDSVLPPANISALPSGTVSAPTPVTDSVLPPANIAALPPDTTSPPTPVTGTVSAPTSAHDSAVPPAGISVLPSDTVSALTPVTGSGLPPAPHSVLPLASISALPLGTVSAPTSATDAVLPPANISALPSGTISAPTPVTDSVLPPASISARPLGTVSAPTSATDSVLPPASISALPSDTISAPTPVTDSVFPPAIISALPPGTISAPTPVTDSVLPPANTSALPPGTTSALTSVTDSVFTSANIPALPPGTNPAPTPVTDSVLPPADTSALPPATSFTPQPSTTFIPPPATASTPPQAITSTPLPATPPQSAEGLTRRARWEAMKVYIRDFAQRFCRERSCRRRAEEAQLELIARQAKAAYARDPDSHGALCSWREAHAKLQEFHHERSRLAALRAGVAWQHYGEQPTFYFHHLSRERRSDTTVKELLVPQGSPQPIPLTTLQSQLQAGAILRDAFSGDSAHGLFRLPAVDAQCQDRLLHSLDTRLPPASIRLAEGPAGDGSITGDELHLALTSMARGKCAGSDGIPYEFYIRFWRELGEDLTAMVQEVLQCTSPHPLTCSQRTGLITLIYKGKGSRADHTNYRPITLLNTDCKIIAKVLATRFGAALDPVIDATQTAFLPGRWIGDNILCHLEEIDYLERTSHPGCVVFLDFEKAYDRLDRGWLLRCMHALGFGAGATRWVSILLAGTQAAVLLNGFRSPLFNIYSGLSQGSPLSPILYIIAAQPLASYLRSLQHLGRLRPITLPSGTPAPVCHQHADDTSLHVRSIADIHVALTEGVQVFCAASNSRLNVGKTKGLLLGSAAGFVGVDELTGVRFVPDTEPIRHLGILLGRDANLCCTQMYASVIAAVRRRAAHWSTQGLTFLGRVYVARQVFASAIYHFATFITPHQHHLTQIVTILCAFAARGDSPVDGYAPRLAPRRAVCSLPWAAGGVRMADVPIMIRALQAKVIARLLGPARLPWKHFATYWITLTDRMSVGLASIFAGTGHRRASMPRRLLGYLTAFSQLQPHRYTPASALTFHQVMREPLFNNRQILGEDGRPLTGTRWASLSAAGVNRVQDLRDVVTAARLGPDSVDAQRASYLLARLPEAWRGHVEGPAAPADWRLSPDGNTVCRVVNAVVTQQHSVLASGCLALADHTTADAFSVGWRDCLVVTCSAPAAAQPSQEQRSAATCMYLVGPWCEVQVDPSVWAVGRETVLSYKVSAAADRLKTIRMLADRGTDYHAGSGLRPKIWQDDWSNNEQGLAAVEERWSAIVRERAASADLPGAAGASRRRPLEEDAANPYEVGSLWLRLQPPAARQHPLQRVAGRAQPDDVPVAATVQVSDEVDVAAQRAGPQPRWHGVWDRLHDSALDRDARALGWRILHGSLNVGAFRAYMTSQLRASPAMDGMCSHPGCQQQPETISHVFIHCPVAAQVTQWLCDVWERVTGGDRPPRSAAVLLADDSTQWDPGPLLRQLWTVLRLTTLAAIWTATTKRNLLGTAVNATGIGAAVVYRIRLLMEQDWQLVVVDIRLQSGVCSAWFRGRSPVMSVDQYAAKWCCRGVLAAAPAGGGDTPLIRPRLRLSATWPVPLPGLRGVGSRADA